MRLVPSEDGTQDKLQLFLESQDINLYNFGDNLTVCPNGHLLVCEDQYTDIVDNHLRGVTPTGKSTILPAYMRKLNLPARVFLLTEKRYL